MEVGNTRLAFITVGVAAFLFFAIDRRGLSAPQSQTIKQVCLIRGTVVDAISDEGLRKAYLRLTGKGGTYAAVTDDHGKFSIENIEPGTYVLTAERQGFIEAQFGEADGQPVEIRLTAGQALDLRFKLTPQAVLSGRVLDEDGDVWVHADVNLYRSKWTHGKRQLQGFSGSTVDDQGEFRIGQIPPGKYFLSAAADASWESRNRPQGQDAFLQRQLTWYPNSLDVEGATAVTLEPGNQLSGLEIRLRRGSVHRVLGRLLGAENVPPPDEALRPFGGRKISVDSTSGLSINSQPGMIHSDGSFEIAGIPSGAYEIHVTQGFAFNQVMLGSMKVQVDDRDLEGVSIQLVPPRPLKGTIKIAEDGSMKRSGLTVRLDAFRPGWTPSAVSRNDGSFDFPSVSSERYRVIVGGYSGNGFYLKQIRYGDIVSSDGTISLTGSGESLVLELSTRGARLKGRVSSVVIDQSVSGTTAPQVVLVSAGESEARHATFDQNGSFSFEDIAPGEYKLYAFEGVPDGAWEDSDFMKEVGSAALDVRLAEAEVKELTVPILPRSTVAPILKKLGLE